MPDRHFKQHRPLYANTLPQDVKNAKMKWKILPIIWLSTKRMATVLGFVVLLNLFLALVIAPTLLSSKTAAPSLPNEMVLFLKFEGGLRETPAPASFAEPFAGEKPTVKDIVEALERARDDDRVKGIVARMYDGGFELSKVSEIRSALKRFKDSGKFAYIYSSSYGEGGGGLGRYYLASAFDEIWMQPLGVVSINGINAEVPFARGLLDKIGIQPQFFKRKDYKTAYESITDKSMSPENREMVERIVNDLREEIVANVPDERGIEASDFKRLIDKGLLTAPEALKSGLITHMDYADVLLDNIAEAVTGERDPDALDLIEMSQYIGVTKNQGHGLMDGYGSKVALVYAVGAIMPSGDGGFGDDGIAAADEIAPAILEASEDDRVEAIILRIDSPGGSPSASESILRAIERAQERGKPVIVSMGSTAASGGYWIAAYADYIYAMPTTITGSIGVVGGKFALRDLFTKIGVSWDEVRWGKNAGLWSANTPFDSSEAERINAMLDNVYDNFIARVAKGRNMSPEEVDKIAGGRVWSGKRAHEIGLVDDLGGLESALDYTAEMLGQDGARDLHVQIYPKPKTALEQFIKLLDTQVRAGQVGNAWQQRFIDVFEPFSRLLAMQENPHHFTTYEAFRLD